MSKFSLATVGLSAALALAAGTIWSGQARADVFGTVYDITYNGCSVGCSTLTSYGTVSVSGNGTNSLTVDIDLAANYYFFGSGNGTTVQFSTSAAVTGNTVSTNPSFWTFVPNATTLATNPLDALGTFQSGFQCDNGASGTNTCGNDFEFTVALNGNGSIISETGGQHGTLFFGLDLCNSTDGGSTCLGTGPFGATLRAVPGPILGAGLPGLIAACAALAAFARRRRIRFA
jgi:hypothetical protein